MAKDDQAILFLPAAASAVLVKRLAVLRMKPEKKMRAPAAQRGASTP
jgi:hypothetical protein